MDLFAGLHAARPAAALAQLQRNREQFDALPPQTPRYRHERPAGPRSAPGRPGAHAAGSSLVRLAPTAPAESPAAENWQWCWRTVKEKRFWLWTWVREGTSVITDVASALNTAVHPVCTVMFILGLVGMYITWDVSDGRRQEDTATRRSSR